MHGFLGAIIQTAHLSTQPLRRAGAAWLLPTLLLLALPAVAHAQSTNTLVADDFAGSAGAPPDAAKFDWAGQVAQTGAGQLNLSTDEANQSWLRSLAGAAPGPGQTLVLQMRAYTYAEGWNPGVYGDQQPRGLRVGTDANNAVEFYSLSQTSVGLRLRKDGVESLATYPLPSGVDSMHDYEISVTTTSVWFRVDGTLAGAFTTNIPTGALNAHVSTFDGYAGNVPVSLESLSLRLVESRVQVTSCDEASLDAALSNNVGEVFFNCDGTIGITTNKVISSDLILDATGHSVTISGGNAVRVFTVNSGVHLTLRNLTIANGNSATLAGGIYNNGGAVTLVDCTFTNNAAVGAADGGNSSGGAIASDSGGTLLATNCTFANNSATGGIGSAGAPGGGTGGMGGYGYGGGIHNNGGSAVIANCTFSGNQAAGGMGGPGGRGVDGYQYWHSVPWPGTGYWVTVYGGPGGRGGNGGYGFGGSLYSASGAIALVNVTLAQGAAVGGAGGSPGSPGTFGSGSYGPGYFGNNSYGGNLGIASGGVALKNTILAYGTGSPGYNCSGTVVDDGNNLCSDTTAGFIAASSLNNMDPLLAALAANGGPTLTVALTSQSPAINAGDDAAAPATDQRHLPRAGLSDIGACEFQTPASVISYAWLQAHGLATDGTAEQADSDFDGLNNFKEWMAGTNPTNALSCLRMLSPAAAGPGLAVRWQSVSGKTYFLERSTDLTATPPFTLLQSNLAGLPGTTLYLDVSAAGSGPFFYRVGVQQ